MKPALDAAEECASNIVLGPVRCELSALWWRTRQSLVLAIQRCRIAAVVISLICDPMVWQFTCQREASSLAPKPLAEVGVRHWLPAAATSLQSRRHELCSACCSAAAAVMKTGIMHLVFPPAYCVAAMLNIVAEINQR